MTKMYRIDFDSMNNISDQEWSQYYSILSGASLYTYERVLHQFAISCSAPELQTYIECLDFLQALNIEIATEKWEKSNFVMLEQASHLLDNLLHARNIELKEFQLVPEDREFVDQIQKKFMKEVNTNE